MVTAIEGNKMAKAGRAAQALATAAIGSFVAGTIGTAAAGRCCAPMVVKFAVSLGAPDYFAIMVLAFVAVTAVLGSLAAPRLRARCVLGLAIGLVGIDQVTGQQRLTFGMPQLADGIDVVVVAVGIFAVGEALWVAAHLRRKAAARSSRSAGRGWAARTGGARGSRGCAAPRSASRSARCPAGGAEIPTFLSYVTEKRLSKHPEEFGKGAIEGVAGPGGRQQRLGRRHAGADAALGLPTNATAAVMLAALTELRHPARPAAVRASEPELVWALIASLFIGNMLLLVLNLPLAPAWAKLLQIPRPYLYAGILFFATLGAYAVNLPAVRPGPAAGARRCSGS